MFEILTNYPLIPFLEFISIISLIILSCKRIQGIFNSFILMLSIVLGISTILLILTGDPDSTATLLLILFALLVIITPFALIINGLIMRKRESHSCANTLSLLLGIFILFGELSFVGFALCDLRSITKTVLNIVLFFCGLTSLFISLFILSFVIYMIYIQILPHKNNYNYIIIHGCGLINGSEVSSLLRSRIDRAITLYHKCKNKPLLIASGGKGVDENISEAEAIKNYLLSNGISEKYIIVEDNSKTTLENLKFSKQIIDSRTGSKKTALVTNNYHVYRCVLLAKSLGFNCTGVGSKTASYYWPSAVIREFIAVYTRRKYILSLSLLYLCTVILPVLALTIDYTK